jgi:DNA-binding NarL/FixJ family response regulator
MRSEIKLLLVDDHALFREGLVRLLEKEGDLTVAAKCATATEALAALPHVNPDVVLLDFDLGAERASDFIAPFREAGSGAKILIVTAGVSGQEAVQLIQSGIAGIFHKHNPPERLCECIRQVAAGELWLEREYLKPLFQSMDPAAARDSAVLTEKERRVLRCVFEGFANKQIAAKLEVSETSVKGILQQLFHKTGVKTRSQLVRISLERYRDQL